MASTYSALKIELIGTGEQSGTWGTTTNTNLGTAIEEAIVGYATANFTSDADLTLTFTDTNASQTARNLVLNVTSSGSLTATRNLIVPTIEKPYYIFNNTTGSQSIVVKTSAGTGITVPNGGKMFVYADGTNVVEAVNRFGSLTLGSALPIASGGTGATSLSAANIPVVNSSNTFTAAQTFRAASAVRSEAASTQDAVVLAGRAGGTSSYASTITPTTLSASRTVTLPDADTTIPVATQVITFSGPTAARTYTLPDSASTLAALATAQTFTALQTFSGSTSVAAAKLTNAKEVCTVSATAATGTINYDVTTQSVLYYTSNASGNWTLNVRGSSGTSLDTLMSTGESITIAFLVTNGATAYYQTALNIDGSAVTPKWQGGTAPTAGNVNSIDAYSVTIVKTGSATFTAFESQTKFA